jgi:GT2 family glycosyltransferase
MTTLTAGSVTILAAVPSLSAIICTRDRGTRVLDAARSILADHRSDLELLVIDQSGDSSVEAALAASDACSRVRYVRTDTRGLSAARNIGLTLATSGLVAMTDDDCTVGAEWAAGIERAFAQHPRAALVFGNVLPAPFDPAEGFIPRYERSTPFLATGLAHKMAVEGIGACMAVRREAVLALGGFDEMLGAGGPFHAGEDVDLTLRVLASGQSVYETPTVHVVHSGFHTWTTGSTLIRRYWFGAGAAFGKHVQVRGARSTGLLSRLAWRFVTDQSPVASGLGLPRMSRMRLGVFMKGLWTGLSTPVDRATGHFARRGVASNS